MISSILRALAKPAGFFLRGILVFLLLATQGCGGFQVKDLTGLFGSQRQQEESAESIAYTAMDSFNRGKYHDALEKFGELKSRYPFSPQGLLAELKAADCHFHLGDFGAALELYREFEERHPTNEAIPYVIYQMAMSHYRQISTVDRDTGNAQEAVKIFTRLLRSHPRSPYTEEAKARIAAAREFLAAHEFFVAQYYLKSESFDEAAGRLAYLLRQYPDAGVAVQARELLTLIKSGKAPRRSWTAYIPKLSLPDWDDLGNIISIGRGNPTPASE